MTQTLTTRVQDLFHRAADLPPAGRGDFLDAACGGDVRLRDVLDRLLAADAADTGFDAPDPSRARPPADARAMPATVGTYRVVRVIGRGGSGVVYEAEQQNPRRAVAVKVLRAGLASPHRAVRFAREAEILGHLRHPGIAQVYEAGVSGDGRPFFAMELVVGGRPLTAHAAQLSVPDRLRLLADVCDAVHHAHENRVVHLDLKPANVLVDDAGRPRVVDFGIARLAEAGGAAPSSGSSLPIGTPAYMSPEQLADGPDVDRRADVYALGVILSETVTGGLPVRYRRDVRAIVGRATARLPADRYPTAAALAADLRRALAGRPVAARPPSTAYRVRRFVRRHPALTLGMASTAGTLVAGAVASALLAVRASAARRAADEFRLTAERNLYVADVRLAREQVTAGRLGDAAGLLAEAVAAPSAAPLRGWEWGFLDRLTRPPVRVFGHAGDGELRRVAVTPDGRLAAAAGRDGAVRVWSLDPATAADKPPAPRFVRRDHTRGVDALAVSPAGDRLASGGWDGRIRVCDPATGRPLPSPPDRAAAVVGLAFGPGGRWFAAARQPNVVALYDAATGRLLAERHAAGDWATGVDVSRDGTKLAVLGEDGGVTVWPVSTGADGPPVIAGDPVTCPGGGHGWPGGLTLSPDGRSVAVGGADGTVTVADATTGRRRQVIDAHDGAVLTVRWSPDGSELATGGQDGRARTWDAATGRARRTYVGHEAWVESVAYEPDGRLVTAGRDGTVRLWSAVPDRRADAATVALPCPATAFAYHPDGRRFAVAGADGTVRVWDAGPDGPPRDLPGNGGDNLRLAASPDGRRLAAAGQDGTVRVWPWSAVGPARPLALRPDPARPAPWVRSVAFGPDSRTLAVGDHDGALRLWDAVDGRVTRQFDVGGHVVAVALSPDGRTIAYAGGGRAAGLIDLPTGRVTPLAGHAAGVNAVTFARDGRTLATAGDDETVRLWDVATARPGPVLRGHTDVVWAVAFSPDGRRIATAGADRVVRVWDAATGGGLTYAQGPARPVRALEFSPDGGRLAAVGEEAAVFVWTGGNGR